MFVRVSDRNYPTLPHVKTVKFYFLLTVMFEIWICIYLNIKHCSSTLQQVARCRPVIPTKCRSVISICSHRLSLLFISANHLTEKQCSLHRLTFLVTEHGATGSRNIACIIHNVWLCLIPMCHVKSQTNTIQTAWVELSEDVSLSPC